ncbi:MAG: DUF3179 domain-containing protein, partial [Acidimicrobiia bacterium]
MRRPVWFVLVALLGVACGGGGSSPREVGSGGGERGAAAPRARVEAGPKEDVPSALDGLEGDGLPAPLVDPADIVSGGPPPDGIPPIDEPTFLNTG